MTMSTVLLVLLALLVAPARLEGRPESAPPPAIPVLTAAPASPGDTAWFGGTAWAPDSARWEAVPGGMWTFDSGVASDFQPAPSVSKGPGLHGLMEGWTAARLGGTEGVYFRRLGESAFAGTACVGDTAGLGGDYSLWAGVLADEAVTLGYAGGQGYGNGWDFTMSKEFFYPGSGSVTLEYDYVNETEPGYDYTFVIVDTSGAGDEVQIAAYDGSVSGHAALVLQPGIHLPTSPGTITIRFAVFSDALYSDQDGLFPTDCGAFAVDDIELSGAVVAGPMTFEAGDEGWVAAAGGAAPVNWSDIVALADLPAMQVPNCGLSDTVLVFYDPVCPGDFSASYALSPWIDLARAGETARRGKVLEFDLYREIQPAAVATVFGVQWDPCIDPVLYTHGVSPAIQVAVGDGYTGTDCRRVRVELGHAVPIEARQIRVLVGTFATCNPGLHSTPWFDNIRVGVHRDPVTLPAHQAPPTLVDSWSAQLNIGVAHRPTAIAVGPLGQVYVADSRWDSIQKYTPDGQLLVSWGETGPGPGEFRDVLGIAVSPDGFVYAADWLNQRIQKFTSDGTYLLEWGTADAPTGVAVDASGSVYVVSHALVEKFTADGTPVTSWPSPSAGRIETRNGLVYVLSNGSAASTVVSVYTDGGTPVDGWGFDQDGSNCAGLFSYSPDLAVGPSGDIYLVEEPLQKYTTGGAFLAGWPAPPFGMGDGGPVGFALSPFGDRLYLLEADAVRVSVYGLSTAGAPQEDGRPAARILGAFPNPTSGGASLVFDLSAGGAASGRRQVAVSVFDLAGRRVRTVHQGPADPGRVEFRWDGRTDAGLPAAAGIYFFRAQVDGREAGTAKLVRIR